MAKFNNTDSIFNSTDDLILFCGHAELDTMKDGAIYKGPRMIEKFKPGFNAFSGAAIIGYDNVKKRSYSYTDRRKNQPYRPMFYGLIRSLTPLSGGPSYGLWQTKVLEKDTPSEEMIKLSLSALFSYILLEHPHITVSLQHPGIHSQSIAHAFEMMPESITVYTQVLEA